MLTIIIKNGRVIDPASGADETRELVIEGGLIVNEAKAEPRVIDAAGMLVLPGFIDLHTHLRQPGFEYKETVETGAKAAAAGGFTTVCAMPNTNPIVDSGETVQRIKALAGQAAVNVLPIGAVTKGQRGEALADIAAMGLAGAVALSEDGKSVSNAGLMREAMLAAKAANLPVFDHCEEPSLKVEYPSSEEAMIAREIILARETGAKLHVCHVSTAGGARLIREAKARGENVTGEVTPHHFTLTRDDIKNANYKMNPPLRSAADVTALKQALKDGAIEVIATDHAPHSEADKSGGYESAANGIIGLETAAAIGYTELVLGGWLTVNEWAAAMAANPAKVLRSDRGTLVVGKPADVTIFDPNAAYAIDESQLAGKSKNTPFIGRQVNGRVEYTIRSGKIVYEREG